MKSLVIKEILEFNSFIFEDSDKKEYRLSIELYNLPKFSVGDTLIIFDERLLNKNSSIYTQPYAFQMAKDDNRINKNNSNSDFAVAIISNKKYYLQRIYG